MQSFFGSIIDGWYNLRYYLITYIYDSTKQLKSQEQIYILNQIIQEEGNVDDRIQKLREVFEKIIWFTYRCKFPGLEQSSYTSDTGWGCMLRVGQMALAQVIKQHYKFTEPAQLIVLLRHFVDNDEQEVERLRKDDGNFYHAPFSIQKIAYQASKEFKLQPGQWYKPNEILFVLQDLYKFSQYSINLKMYINPDNAFVLEDIIDTMYGQKKGNLAWLEEQVKEKTQQPFGVAIYILTRIGLDSCNKAYLKILNELMASKYFQGILGGQPNRALYIFGRVGDYYMYLDPHYVQTAQSFNELSHDQESYYCKNIQLIHNTYLDPSMAISFHVRNGVELLELWNELQQLKSQFPEQFFMALSEQNHLQQLTQSFLQEDDDDEFVTILQ